MIERAFKLTKEEEESQGEIQPDNRSERGFDFPYKERFTILFKADERKDDEEGRKRGREKSRDVNDSSIVRNNERHLHMHNYLSGCLSEKRDDDDRDISGRMC